MNTAVTLLPWASTSLSVRAPKIHNFEEDRQI